MPKLFRDRLRAAIEPGMQPAFDELCAWEDDIVEALNIASAAADRMAAALERIEENTPCVIGLGASSKHGDKFCVYHIAREARLG